MRASSPCLSMWRLALGGGKELAPTVCGAAGLRLSASSHVIGAVSIGRDCRIGPGAVLRGDVNSITLGDGVSIGPNTVLHVARFNAANSSIPTKVRCKTFSTSVRV